MNSPKKFEVGDYIVDLESGREARIMDEFEPGNFSFEYLDSDKPRYGQGDATSMQHVNAEIKPINAVAPQEKIVPIETPILAEPVVTAPAAPIEPAIESEIVAAPAPAAELVDATVAPAIPVTAAPVDAEPAAEVVAPLYAIGDRAEHRQHGLVTVIGNSDSGVHVRYDDATEEVGGENDIVCADDLQSLSPYTKDEAAAIIRKHFSLIFEDDDWGCVTFVNRANDSAPVVNKVNSTTRFTTDRGIAELFKQNETQDVYVAMNSVEKKKEARRKKECLGDCRNVFMEVDENGDAVLAAVRASVAKKEIPRPSVILQSSPGKYQFVWPIVVRTVEHPDGFTMEKLEATNEALVRKFGGDPACSDVLRLFRIPCLRNLKYPQRPVVEVIEANDGPRYNPSDFEIAIDEVKKAAPARPPADKAELVATSNYAETNMTDANIKYAPLKKWGENGWLWELKCPWCDSEHTGQKDSGTILILHKSGALDFTCAHGHCKHIRRFQQFRDRLQEIVGHVQKWGDGKDPGVHLQEFSIRTYSPDPDSDPNPALASAPATEAKTVQTPEKNELAPAVPAPQPTQTPLDFPAAPKPAIGGHHGISAYGKSRLPDALGDDAYYGIAGRHIRNIEARSEAHPAGIIGLFLSGFGSMVGTIAFVRIEDNLHYPIVNVLVTGRSGRSRKDTAIGRALRPLRMADPTWSMKSVHQSFSSGEAVVSFFNDLDKKCLPIRLFVTDTEFKTTLSICTRAGNTLSQAYRHMFNGDPMEVRTKHEILYSEKSCGTLAGLITKGELQETLKAVEVESGFVNRFLLLLVHRVKKISRVKGKLSAEEVKERNQIVKDLEDVLTWINEHMHDVHIEDGESAHGLRLEWNEEAGLVWDDFYDRLDDDDPEYLNRAEVFVLRLTMIYALLDKSMTMKLPHLKAALAVWAYAARSAELVLGVSLSPDVERLSNKALATGKLMRGGVLSFFGRNKSAEEIDWLIEEAAKASHGKLVVIMGKDKFGEPQPKGLAVPAKAVETVAESKAKVA